MNPAYFNRYIPLITLRIYILSEMIEKRNNGTTNISNTFNGLLGKCTLNLKLTSKRFLKNSIHTGS